MDYRLSVKFDGIGSEGWSARFGHQSFSPERFRVRLL